VEWATDKTGGLPPPPLIAPMLQCIGTVVVPQYKSDRHAKLNTNINNVKNVKK